jgi:hypothetical protein
MVPAMRAPITVPLTGVLVKVLRIFFILLPAAFCSPHPTVFIP